MVSMVFSMVFGDGFSIRFLWFVDDFSMVYFYHFCMVFYHFLWFLYILLEFLCHFIGLLRIIYGYSMVFLWSTTGFLWFFIIFMILFYATNLAWKIHIPCDLLMGFYFANLVYSNVSLLYVLISIIGLIKMNFYCKVALERCEELLEFMEDMQVRGSQVQCQAPDIGPDMSWDGGPEFTYTTYVRR